MPFQINRAPLGLNDLIGGKTWPVNQDHMADQVVSVIESLDLYMLANSEIVGGAANPGAAGGFQLSALIVPSGEWWYCHKFSAFTAGMGAGQSISFKLGFFNNQVAGGSSYWSQPEAVTDTTAVGQIGWAGWLPRCWLRPGMQFLVQVEAIAAGPININGSAEITRIRI